ncbi:hypothetical protein I7I48_07073 [Histoplasma ohiense]|nr:hypothetical protein I7I48_07073 [Histoplasma ohiense (nom. inval.)]
MEAIQKGDFIGSSNALLGKETTAPKIGLKRQHSFANFANFHSAFLCASPLGRLLSISRARKKKK